MLSRIRKDDTVFVVSGKDKGKQGRVILVDHKNNTALVKDINIVTRHQKARRQGQKGGIVKEEYALGLGKVMPVCKKCSKPCRIRVKELEGAKKVRSCHRCQEEF